MLKLHPLIRVVAALLAGALAMPPLPSAAAEPAGAARSIAVVPLLDGDADAESREAAAAIGDALRVVTGHHVVASDVAARVADYQGADRAEAADLKAATDAIARAKEHYFNFRYREAQDELAAAIEALEKRRTEPGAGALLVDALISKALIAKSRSDAKVARQSLDAALAVDPALELKSADYPPSLVALFEEVRSSRASMPAGSLSVTSKPAGAEVLLNGVSRGATPIEIPHLPAGTYALLLTANNYRQDLRSIEVAADKRLAVDVRLKWQAGGKGRGATASADDAAAAVREGLRVADALKVDQVVLVDADAASGDAVQVTARTVDRALRAGQRPIVVPKFASVDRHERLATLTTTLADQIDANLLNDPARELDPLGQGDPVLLAKRKPPLTRRPLFWAIVGTVAAGAIAGGIAASMGGGAQAGSVKVSFK